jgi:predicted Zn-dependent protease
MRSLVLTAVVLSVALGAIGCGTTPKKPEKKPIILRTAYDDARAGADASKEVEAEMGLYKDPALTAYIAGVGKVLSRYAPLQRFDYHFEIVDQPMPNAFALPGGHIYLSRGLIALASSEDELANVVGHEITHAAARHHAAQQEIARRQMPLSMPALRMGRLAAYGREQELDADQGGQFLANAAGYDPMGMSTFLRKLGNVERQKIGYSRLPGYFDTHPGSTERSASAADRAGGARRQPNAGSEASRNAYLKRIDGLVLGTNPAEGIFEGSVFVHPDLGFHMRFPSGWQLTNSPKAVGARSPNRDAMIFAIVEGPGEDAHEGAKTFIEKHGEEYGVEVQAEGAVKVGEIDAWRMQTLGFMQGTRVAADLTFVPFGGLIYRLTVVTPPRSADKYMGRGRASVRSFGPITLKERQAVVVTRLRVVPAVAGESLSELSKRSGNDYGIQETAVLNGLFADARLSEGQLVKIARSQPYVSKPASH